MIADAIQPWLKTLDHYKRIHIACSGGLDSSVLLHVLSQIPELKGRLCCLHINHGLHARAGVWQSACHSQAKMLDLPFKALAVDAQALAGESPEQAARKARYRAFLASSKPQDVIALGHHQNDQAETLLLQLMRGSGLSGLAAMPTVREWKKRMLFRPLLSYSRAQLKAYAVTHRLRWIEDESNQDLAFDRNFMRHQILPQLEKRWPNAIANIARSAQHLGEALHLNERLAEQVWQDAKEKTQTQLSLTKLRLYRSDEIKAGLRFWLKKNQLTMPSTIKLEYIVESIYLAPDKQPQISWLGGEVRRFKDRLYAFANALEAIEEGWQTLWNMNQPCPLPHGCLMAVPSQGSGLKATLPSLTVRFRAGGERMQLAGRAHHHSLKKLFQEWEIPPWERDRIPLLYHGEVLVMVVGYAVAEGFQASAQEPSWDIQFEEN